MSKDKIVISSDEIAELALGSLVGAINKNTEDDGRILSASITMHRNTKQGTTESISFHVCASLDVALSLQRGAMKTIDRISSDDSLNKLIIALRESELPQDNSEDTVLPKRSINVH